MNWMFKIVPRMEIKVNEIVLFVALILAFMVFLISRSVIRKKLRRNQKILIIIIESILSIIIPLLVNNYFLKTYPEHYEAQFIDGLLNAVITLFSMPVYALAFIAINRFFNVAKVSRVVYSILLILVAIAIQAGAIYFFDQPYIIFNTPGW
ncbi:hypothetical protein PSTEL_08190 [Paenibacillus stellifer]|uniref:Uncharacterized protein n=1 Tax=Paenibacillus stellifer TaxID=169760 RepID=A0A089LNE8_9BACL|nr:hypothetical protein [Paenibacillus stellifer]AIQ63076.1 hypothetical protein PSTEL_08190 [Paenibacillus stellifer]